MSTKATNTSRVLSFLRKGACTGMDIIKALEILSYNTAIYQLRQQGYVIGTTLIINPDGSKYGIFELEE